MWSFMPNFSSVVPTVWPPINNTHTVTFVISIVYLAFPDPRRRNPDELPDLRNHPEIDRDPEIGAGTDGRRRRQRRRRKVARTLTNVARKVGHVNPYFHLLLTGLLSSLKKLCSLI